MVQCLLGENLKPEDNPKMTTTLNMQVRAQRHLLGALPHIAARKDARLVLGFGFAGAALTNPVVASAEAAADPSQGFDGANANNTACQNSAIQNIVKIINYATNALIAVIAAVVIFRFAMAAGTLVFSNKPGRGKKALNDIMWVGAGLVIAILIFPLRAGIILVMKALFGPEASGTEAVTAQGGIKDTCATTGV